MAITVTHTKVSTVPDSADTSLVRPSDWNATHTLSGLGTAAELDAGVANGVASLDSAGKVPITELPAAVLGALSYQGTWNASTNTPTLASGVGTKGYYYVVDTAGSTNLDGITDWKIGDWAVFNGTAWQKVDNTDSVTSVNGYTGAVVLTQTDIAGTANAPTNTNITSMTGVTGGISSPDFVQFDTTVAVTEAVAKLQWDDGNGTLQFGLKGGNVNLQVGQELVARVYNDSGVALSDGQIVYISGAQGNRIAVKLARADSEATSKGTLGMVTESIAIGAEGFITIMGVVNKLNTTGLTAGNLLFLSATVAGAYTETIPTAPNHKVTIGYVERVDNIVGAIYVKVDNGYELDELHNVNIVTPTGGQLLAYDQTAGYWKNINLTDGTGISITEASNGAVTVTNSAPDQTVSLTGAGTTTISGTYPSFTITSNDQFTGTVTSVGGTGTVNGLTLTGTVTTSGDLTLGGTLDLASPPAIGGTTPAAGAFTTLSMNGGAISPQTGFKNRIINGGMTIDQRNAGASVTQNTAGIYTVDRWGAYGNVTSKFTVQRSTTAPAGFINSALLTSSSAYSVGSSDQFVFYQNIEGFNAADLAWGTASAQAITVSFWVRSSLTGTFGGSIRNGSYNRSYPFSFTISSANTYEYKTVTIAGDTTGTWATDNSIGLILAICMGAGSSLLATGGAWAAGNFVGATGATSVVGTNGATFYITGVQLEKGSVATPFEFRSIGTEEILCYRYFQTYSNPPLRGAIGSSGTIANRVGMILPVVMRTQPTAVVGALDMFDGVNVTTVASVAQGYFRSKSIEFDLNLTAALGAFRPACVYLSGSTNNLSVSAEL